MLSDAYKQAYIDAGKEDIQIIQSPVGMPGRALRNDFIKNLRWPESLLKNVITVLKNVIRAQYRIVLQKH